MSVKCINRWEVRVSPFITRKEQGVVPAHSWDTRGNQVSSPTFHCFFFFSKLRRLVAGFAPGSVHVGFVAALGQIFLQVLWFSAVSTPPWLSILKYHLAAAQRHPDDVNGNIAAGLRNEELRGREFSLKS
jgi:hypothetical protein